MKKAHSVILLLLLGLLSLQFKCNKNLDCARNVYDFGMGVRAYPDEDRIHVGDTIWLEVKEPTNSKDYSTGNLIDYSGAANLGSAIGFQLLSPVSGQFTISAAQKVGLVIVNGMETGNADAALYHEFLFRETNNTYLFKVGVILQETGTFRLVFSNAANVYRKNDRCTKAAFSLTFKNTDQHYYLNPNFQGGPTPVGGDYYFKVY